jgi:hypothetical protein
MQFTKVISNKDIIKALNINNYFNLGYKKTCRKREKINYKNIKLILFYIFYFKKLQKYI